MTEKKTRVGLHDVLSGLFVMIPLAIYALYTFEYKQKPFVFNLFGLNPTTSWVGKAAPDFVLPDLMSNKTYTLRQFLGKVVLLEFWASWCHSCQKQMPVFQRLAKDLPFARDVQILSINIKETSPLPILREYVKRKRIDIPVLLGTDKIVERYRIWHFPAVVLIDKKGKVRYAGAEIHSEEAIRHLVAGLKKE